MKQRDFLKEAGNRAVIWISPRAVPDTIGGKWPVGRARLKALGKVLPRPILNLIRPSIKHAEPFAVPAGAFGQPSPVVETGRYILLSDLDAHRADLRSSQWYRELVAELERSGSAWYKTRRMTTESQIHDFLQNYMLPLIDSISTTGFDESVSHYESSAVIGPDGQLYKTGSGNHRFCIAQMCDLPRFPLRIVSAHEHWLRKELDGPLTTEAVLALLPAVEARHRARPRQESALA